MSQRNSREAKARRRAERNRQRAALDALAPGPGDFVFGGGLEVQAAPDDQCMWAAGCAAPWVLEIDICDGLSTRLCVPHGQEFTRLNEDSIAPLFVACGLTNHLVHRVRRPATEGDMDHVFARESRPQP